MSQLGRPHRFYRSAGSGVRNESEHLRLIVNPRAGAGTAGRRLPELEAAAARAFARWDVALTRGPGHAAELASAAIAEGVHIIAAVGGDGTCHEVVQGLVRDGRPRSRKVAFTTVPLGTGSDLMKTLQIPRSLPAALWIAATGITLPTDLAEATVATPEGDGPRRELFINVAGFGLNGEVVASANRSSKRWGGAATFLAATVRSTLAWRAPEVRLSWSGPDGDGAWQGRLLSCFLANGAYCGGGMWVGKGGTMHDGLLDLTILPETPLGRQLLQARRLYDGLLAAAPHARRVAVHELRAEVVGSEPVRVDLDGEAVGTLPLRVRVLPAALQVRGGWLRNPHL